MRNRRECAGVEKRKGGDWPNNCSPRSRPRRNGATNDPKNALAMKTFLHRRPTIGSKFRHFAKHELREDLAICGPLRSYSAVSSGALAIGATAIGALSLGALTLGAVAIARLVIGRLFIKKAKFGTLDVGTLRVGKLEVAERVGEETGES
jgi:hypothetical protein